MRRPFAAIAGAVVGYVCLTVLANAEVFQFYTIRSVVTGETAMSRIVEHPADAWVVPILLLGFCSTGALAGWLFATAVNENRTIAAQQHSHRDSAEQ